VDDVLPHHSTEEMTRQALTEIVGMGIGAASVCWEDMSGTGIFQSDRAAHLVDEIMRAVEQHVDRSITEHMLIQREKDALIENEANPLHRLWIKMHTRKCRKVICRQASAHSHHLTTIGKIRFTGRIL
jgi:hypothetical protein